MPINQLSNALWRLYNRPQRPSPWSFGGNLPWDDPQFSRRMLREHLDESHGAASRVTAERELQIGWLRQRLELRAGDSLLDITCGPGLYAVAFAHDGIMVTGVDFSPASIDYAKDLAKKEGVNGRCRFLQEDIRNIGFAGAAFDAAILLYGQLAVLTKAEAQTVLTQAAKALKPGGKLCVEMLNPARVDKENSSWWYTDDTGLWGDSPFLHLGERFWDADASISIERFHILHLETGKMDEIQLCDQVYKPAEMIAMMKKAGLGETAVYPAWDNLPLYDADEWLVYVSESCPPK